LKLFFISAKTAARTVVPVRNRFATRYVLRVFLGAAFAASLGMGVGIADPAKPPMPEEEMVYRYLEASHEQQDTLRGATVEVDIDASVPKLQKQGKLQALKSVSKLGKITYHLLGFSGDNSVKTEVIARYLKAEVDASDGGSNLSINPENYKFKYKGVEDWNGRQVYVLRVNPRHKKVGLIKGELWLDAETYMPVRESGSFVKSPSIFLKKMEFVRDYLFQNGVSMPWHMVSKVETRFFGPVELNVNYASYVKDQTEPVTADASNPAATAAQ